ncbi:glycosyltransferase family 2 protein [Priestia taiwanensis]|uniref:Glycosyltransferase 2-like domain-containing protein n=1 Tax=Priestia taiwanensis TaxID=1347902 RepID=A0A917ATH3_9BACI|nr:glycosyltransferase [Priestia taiwanensis]MBM7364125.1 glycosyltransferase involved in cell wall biosynthesis [Priestia taiwanensis]GGE71767.1 hypothetical protein GCM10007140_22190 [Priestia taiwanensis]
MQQPLVSFLMFTKDNPDYADLTLKSIVLQTYDNIEVLICDTSKDNHIEELVNKQFKPHFSYITYVRKEIDTSQVVQAQVLMNMAKGEYVNFVCNGDLLYPQRIERLMKYFLEDNQRGIQVVMSNSAHFSNHGIVAEGTHGRKKLFLRESVVEGRGIGMFILSESHRFLGTITAALFRKSAIFSVGELHGHVYSLCWDLATLLTALRKGSTFYVPHTFVYSRDEERVAAQEDNVWNELIEELEISSEVMKKNDFNMNKEKTEELVNVKVAQIENALKSMMDVQARNRLMKIKGEMESLLQEIR